MILQGAIEPIDGKPYTMPTEDQERVVLQTTHGTIDVVIRVIVPDWAPNNMIRIEGLTTYEGREKCLVVAAYHVDVEPNHQYVGDVDIYTD